MSEYNGRQAPNVSQYIANLNAIPSSHELNQQPQDGFTNYEDDLAMFTNTQFFDFDMVEQVDATPVEYDATAEVRARRENASAYKHNSKPVDYMNGEFQFSEFASLPTLLPDNSNNNNTTIAPAGPTTSYPRSTPLSPTTTTSSKRTLSVSSPTTSHTPGPADETSRLAAEEDKRRRNTAASARFRVKKKQREQTLERTAKEMTDKVSALESRIGQLETENKWLKNLITEKNDNGAKDDVAEMWRKFSSERKDGVGTGIGAAGAGGKQGKAGKA